MCMSGAATGGSARVIRGGSWIYHGQECRSAFPFRFSPDYRVCYLGFRVAVS